MTRRVDVVVIGCGVMGAATARALARAGEEVVVFERFTIPHARGSSHGSARVFRMSYPDPTYVRMMREALPLWRELEDERGEQLLAVTGALNVGARAGELEPSFVAAGVPFEWLDAAESARRFPAVAPAAGLFDPTAGIVAAEQAWLALVSSARAHGAEVVENARASVAVTGGEPVVTVGGEEVRARRVVVTAGPWLGELLPQRSAAVRTTRETVTYYDVGTLDGVPVILDWDDPFVYALPTPAGTLKAGLHHGGPEADPEEDAAPAAATTAVTDGWVRARLGTARRVAEETCFYTTTPDEAFILERDGPVVVGSPCSGHGFKFAPLIGARLAALART